MDKNKLYKKVLDIERQEMSKHVYIITLYNNRRSHAHVYKTYDECLEHIWRQYVHNLADQVDDESFSIVNYIKFVDYINKYDISVEYDIDPNKPIYIIQDENYVLFKITHDIAEWRKFNSVIYEDIHHMEDWLNTCTVRLYDKLN